MESWPAGPRLKPQPPAVLCASVALALFAAAAPLDRHEFTEPHMGTTFRIVLYAPDDGTARAEAAKAFARIGELDAALSDYRPTSELSRVTREAVGRPVRVSDDLLGVLIPAQVLARRSDGAFDITVGALTRLWRRARREIELPSAQDLAAARAVTGFRLLHVDEQAHSVRVDREGMQLDAGGIAKGFAADQALRVLTREGFPRAMVAAGGDIALGDPPPGRRGWEVALAGLDSDGTAPSSPRILQHAGVSTSGDAEQWVEIGGVRYSHIIDPHSGWPLRGRSSVSVVATDATTSDMLATAIDVLGPDRGRRLVDGWPGAAALIGTREGGADRWVRSKRWTGD
jgi:thiamine biosynthesis lipoprotein